MQVVNGTQGLAGQGISVQSIDAVANQIGLNSYVYDGAGSSAPYTVADFGSLPGDAAVFPGETVGDVFKLFPGIVALSQKTGFAVFVNSALWANMSPDYGVAIMLHEIIHKFGLYDGDMATALGVKITKDNTDTISQKLYKDCIQ